MTNDSPKDFNDLVNKAMDVLYRMKQDEREGWRTDDVKAISVVIENNDGTKRAVRTEL